MKKLVALALALIMALGLAACGSAGSNEDTKWPEKNIDLIVPFAPGGAMDRSARLTAKYLEKELGVTISVKNVEGGNNWVGYGQVLNAKGDGYTLGFSNYPGQVGGYLNPSAGIQFTYKSFTNIADIVHDPGIIAVKYDSPYKTLDDLIEAGKKEALSISTGGGAGSDDDVLVTLLNKRFGTQFVSGRDKGDSDAAAAMLGGHVAAQACNVSNYALKYKNTEGADAVRILAVFNAERVELMSDIPTAKELGYDLSSSSDRGMVACKDLDKAVLSKLVDALKKVQENPDFQKEASEQGMVINMLFGEDFEKYIQGVEDTLNSMKKELGWE